MTTSTYDWEHLAACLWCGDDDDDDEDDDIQVTPHQHVTGGFWLPVAWR